MRTCVLPWFHDTLDHGFCAELLHWVPYCCTLWSHKRLLCMWLVPLGFSKVVGVLIRSFSQLLRPQSKGGWTISFRVGLLAPWMYQGERYVLILTQVYYIVKFICISWYSFVILVTFHHEFFLPVHYVRTIYSSKSFPPIQLHRQLRSCDNKYLLCCSDS